MKVLQFTVPMTQRGSVVVQEDNLPYFYNFFHRHTEGQVTLILKGEGTLIAGNYTQPFKAGEIYILGANQPHIFKAAPRYFETEVPNSIHAIHLYFDHDRLLSGIFNMPEFDQIRKFVRASNNGFQLPERLAPQGGRLIRKINSAGGTERLITVIRLFHFFANEVKEWKSLSTGTSKQAFTDMEGLRMNDIYQYTIDHFTDDISLSQIAGIAHMTPHAFCKYFKKHTRKTYMGFLNEVRINEACKKLINGNFESISTIAYANGFNNTITFNRVFKKVMGMNPTDYINSYKRK
ncbi:AraC family transcriptional regulator [Paraflavitalea sp. CAU 1676]|uniref:AraC family transcriptional regulator n=1 Tax=Paraflavitalea sp. CAU 1676 TaxID=3032598 RepID=UPI0023DA6223|nr:AraC family transcriptional regulator [Paraflavitalea sp. CAU 1676]MDF2189885.1 AraC family transcriptional regulator [Paraflavitalea sp. CAU 1676]